MLLHPMILLINHGIELMHDVAKFSCLLHFGQLGG